MITSNDMDILMDRMFQWSYISVFCIGRNYRLPDVLLIEEKYFSILGEYY